MVATPDSGAASYASTADLAAHYDVRVLCQLVADDTAAIDPSDLAANTVAQAALGAASGRLEASALRGGRYSPADLAAIAAASTVGARYMKGLVCHLAFEELRTRRPLQYPEPTQKYKEAIEDLKALRTGEILFGTIEHEQAGLPDADVETAPIVEQRNLTTLQAGRLYGTRANRRPRG